MTNIYLILLFTILVGFLLWNVLKRWWENEGQANPEEIYIFAAITIVGFLVAMFLKNFQI